MKSLTAKLILSIGLALSNLGQAYGFEKRATADGVQYGFHQGNKSSPLLIIITTDIQESMTDVYSSVGGTLANNGYNIASIDVTCHGKDLNKNEKYGLDCWRSRADASSKNIFDDYIHNLKSVISDISKNKLTKSSDIAVLGVSRGGYLAFMAASKISGISTIIALAPVTDIFRLREFHGSSASRSIYSLARFYPEIAKNISSFK